MRQGTDQLAHSLVVTETEAKIARTAAEKLRAAASQNLSIAVQGEAKTLVPLPSRASALMLQVLEAMGDGRSFSLIPHDTEMTTQQAADYLNVSRPYLCGLLDKGEVVHRLVGRHRRVKFADLFDYEKRSKIKQRDAIERMVAEAQRLGLD